MKAKKLFVILLNGFSAFESLVEILKCDLSSYRAALSCDSVFMLYRVVLESVLETPKCGPLK